MHAGSDDAQFADLPWRSLMPRNPVLPRIGELRHDLPEPVHLRRQRHVQCELRRDGVMSVFSELSELLHVSGVCVLPVVSELPRISVVSVLSELCPIPKLSGLDLSGVSDMPVVLLLPGYSNMLGRAVMPAHTAA